MFIFFIFFALSIQAKEINIFCPNPEGVTFRLNNPSGSWDKYIAEAYTVADDNAFGLFLSNPTYMKIREALGVSEYSKDTEEFLTKKEEQKRPDVFEMVTDTSNKNQTQGESK